MRCGGSAGIPKDVVRDSAASRIVTVRQKSQRFDTARRLNAGLMNVDRTD